MSNDQVSSLPVRLSTGPYWSEHGFVIFQADPHGAGYWTIHEPGVHAGPGWVRVGSGAENIYVALELTIREAGAATEELPTLTVSDEMTVADPVSTWALSWTLGPGRYTVSATFEDLPAVGNYSAQHWRIDMVRHP